jgi:hypothetical protein
MPAPDLIRGGRPACDRFCSTRKPAASPADGLCRKQNRAICVRRALVRAQAKPLLELTGPLRRGRASGHRSRVLSVMSAVLLSNDRWRQNAPSGIVKTISPLRFVWRASAAARSIGSMKARPPINSAAARNAKNNERMMTTRVLFRMLLVSPHAREPTRRHPAPIGWRPRSDRACPFNCPHPGIKQDNRCVADKTSSSI